MGRPAGHTTKYTKAVVEFILDHIADGMTLQSICKKYHPEYVPTEKMIYTWKKKYPDFKEKLNEAYEDFLYKKIDEHEDLSKECMELERNLETAWEKLKEEPKKGAKSLAIYTQLKIEALKNRDRRDNIRIRMQALQFTIQKILPKICNDFRDSKAAAAPSLPAINIVSFKTEPQSS